jgi:hypothetical protein
MSATNVEIHVPARPTDDTLQDILYDATAMVMLDKWDVYIVVRNNRQAARLDKMIDDKGLSLIWNDHWDIY